MQYASRYFRPCWIYTWVAVKLPPAKLSIKKIDYYYRYSIVFHIYPLFIHMRRTNDKFGNSKNIQYQNLIPPDFFLLPYRASCRTLNLFSFRKCKSIQQGKRSFPLTRQKLSYHVSKKITCTEVKKGEYLREAAIYF